MLSDRMAAPVALVVLVAASFLFGYVLGSARTTVTDGALVAETEARADSAFAACHTLRMELAAGRVRPVWYGDSLLTFWVVPEGGSRP